MVRDLNLRLDLFNLVLIVVELLLDLFLLVFIREDNENIGIVLSTELLHDDALILWDDLGVEMDEGLESLQQVASSVGVFPFSVDD